MNHAQFMDGLLKPAYVWRNAHARYWGKASERKTDAQKAGYFKAAETQMDNAQQQIDDLVLERARTIFATMKEEQFRLMFENARKERAGE